MLRAYESYGIVLQGLERSTHCDVLDDTSFRMSRTRDSGSLLSLRMMGIHNESYTKYARQNPNHFPC
jgi:hypothetical protein